MYHVKVKRFLDSLQIQYYEAEPEKKVTCEKTTLFEDIRNDKFDRFEKVFEHNNMIPFQEFSDTVQNFEVDENEQCNKNESLRISMSRTIRKIYDYGKCNRWEWFFTLTFDPEKVNSFDFSETSKKLSLWLNNMKKKCPDMKYLIVPEKHVSGRWHFHGLFSNVDSLEFESSGKFTDKGQEIFNVGKYKLGFSTAIKCDGSMKVVGYVTKYITKELCEISKGKKRYWVSRNLDLPDVIDYYTHESFYDVITVYDVSQAYLKSVEGFVNFNICEIPIYSTNTERFRERISEEEFL